MTLSTILAELYRRLNYEASPATAVTTELTAYINTTYRQLLTIPGMEFLRDDTITVASVAAQARYGLPQALARIKTIHDRTNDRRLIPQTLDWLRTVDPGLDSSGTPTHYIPVGFMAVAKQPSDASVLLVDSDSASDDATKTAYIEAVRTGGYPTTISKDLNGVTAVSFVTADLIEVTKFYITLKAGGATTAAGNVTLVEDAEAGTELARIPAGQSFARYYAIQLWPTPSAAVTYYVDYQRNIPDMSVVSDEPLLPPDFHDLIVLGAERMAWRKKDDDRWQDAKQEYDRRVSQLKYWLSSSDAIPVLGGRAGARISRLGGWYPADTVIG